MVNALEPLYNHVGFLSSAFWQKTVSVIKRFSLCCNIGYIVGFTAFQACDKNWQYVAETA
ncbi:hypothetical protein [Shewanella sp. Actino-trap-3]|uniref:hypothetical protein n=1 Tax=Shewanella sp. Actino-trap-3 TaxID=2058331 RepID=UPI0012FF051F|nr:hypothetical protein [Shewanella sp. Actino-trap-3]